MEFRDLIVTPLLVLFVYLVAYLVRPRVTDGINRQYFLPALTFKIIGALAVGFIYQFYYGGGDTFNFHTHGSRHIWEAFIDAPDKGLKLLFADGSDQTGIYKYSSRIPFFHDRASYNVIRVASVFDLLTFSAYSGTAVLFSLVSFAGGWLLFISFYRTYPHLHRSIAIAVLFIPSIFFWGSGLLKDTLTLSLLCASTYFVRQLLIERKIKPINILLLTGCLYGIYAIKIYILLTFLPSVLLMFYALHVARVKSFVLKLAIFPFVFGVAGISSYVAVEKIGTGDQRYNVDKLGETAKITAYDIAFQTGRDAGSTYALGELDGTMLGMLNLAPQAINVTLFRPYLWEVRNPLMLIAAFESFVFLILTLYVLFSFIRRASVSILNPDVILCLTFSVVTAFGVGISSYNFGTLSRYKIPLLPFYIISLILILWLSKRERKVSEFERTE